MRGTVGSQPSQNIGIRITPAHAGNSGEEPPEEGAGEDHPRTCGEQQSAPADNQSAMGSPPHMRGTVSSLTFMMPPFGITPAHAGNRRRLIYDMDRTTDHPRTCGEQFSDSVIPDIASGSPPHMRGTVYNPRYRSFLNRITPAHAGNSVSSTLRGSRSRDHPRTCGEQFVLAGASRKPIGSPPHMRGTATL